MECGERFSVCLCLSLSVCKQIGGPGSAIAPAMRWAMDQLERSRLTPSRACGKLGSSLELKLEFAMAERTMSLFGRKKERARVSVVGPIELNGVLAAKQDRVSHQRRNS